MTFRRGRGVPLHNRVEKQVEKPPQERRKKTSDISSVSLCHSACGYEVGRIVAILQMVITEISEVRSFPYVRITCYLVAKSCPALWPRGLQHARLPYPFLSPRAFSNACPLSWWCHPTISSSVTTSSLDLSLSQHQDLFQWSCIGSLFFALINCIDQCNVLCIRWPDIGASASTSALPNLKHVS